MGLHNNITALLDSYQDYPWFVAVSGGKDSVVLLDILAKSYPQQIQGIVHVNHQLQAQAGSWESFCKELADKYQIAFYSHRLKLTASSEAAAREARYDIFAQYMQKPTLMLTAHHRDDQVETALWRFLRGSPPAGWIGMNAVRALNAGWIVRPLLKCSRSMIDDYATDQNLTWCDDPTNSQEYYTRNFLRNAVIPLLEQRFPSLKKQVGKSIHLAKIQQEMLSFWLSSFIKNATILNTLDYPDRRQESLFGLCLNWLNAHHQPQPSFEALEQFVSLVERRCIGVLNLGNQMLSTQYGIIWRHEPYFYTDRPPEEILIDSDMTAFMWGQKRIIMNKAKFNDKISVRRLTKHDRMPNGQRAQEYWQSQRIPAFMRPWIPAFFQGKTFIQYGSYCYNEALLVNQPFDVT